MGCRMIFPCLPASGIHNRRHRPAHLQNTSRHPAAVNDAISDFLRRLHRKNSFRRLHSPAVGHLAARFRIKTRAVKNQPQRTRLCRNFSLRMQSFFVNPARNLRCTLFCLILQGIIRTRQLNTAEKSVQRSAFLRCAGLRTLLFHQPIKPLCIHLQVLLAGHQFRQVQRKTIGIIKPESIRSGNHPLGG